MDNPCRKTAGWMGSCSLWKLGELACEFDSIRFRSPAIVWHVLNGRDLGPLHNPQRWS